MVLVFGASEVCSLRETLPTSYMTKISKYKVSLWHHWCESRDREISPHSRKCFEVGGFPFLGVIFKKWYSQQKVKNIQEIYCIIKWVICLLCKKKNENPLEFTFNTKQTPKVFRLASISVSSIPVRVEAQSLTQEALLYGDETIKEETVGSGSLDSGTYPCGVFR